VTQENQYEKKFRLVPQRRKNKRNQVNFLLSHLKSFLRQIAQAIFLVLPDLSAHTSTLISNLLLSNLIPTLVPNLFRTWIDRSPKPLCQQYQKTPHIIASKNFNIKSFNFAMQKENP
jgi:hypothetical protein